jgi:hypothetical protein
MHSIEPHYNWRHLYISSEDRHSPFFGRQYSEFEFTNTIYDYFIHPQWDHIGSTTLYLKILYANYDLGYCIIELIGEWNDCLYNDIMYLKRDIADTLIENGINKFILICENVLNFHSGDDDYYQEWFDDIEDGWIVLINCRDHVIQEIESGHLDYYMAVGGAFNNLTWRNLLPAKVFDKVNQFIRKRLPA